MIDPKVWSNFPAKEPEMIIRALSEHILAQGNAEPHRWPHVSLSMRSGPPLSGQMINLSNDRRREVVLLISDDADVSELIYAPLDEIVAVRVRVNPWIVPVLSFGAVARPMGEPEPSRLEIKRQIEQANQRLQTEQGLSLELSIDWPGIPDVVGVLPNIKDLVNALIPVIKTSAKGSLGREAWDKILTLTIHHQANAVLGVNREGQNLAITLDISRVLPQQLEKVLVGAIDQAL